MFSIRNLAPQVSHFPARASVSRSRNIPHSGQYGKSNPFLAIITTCFVTSSKTTGMNLRAKNPRLAIFSDINMDQEFRTLAFQRLLFLHHKQAGIITEEVKKHLQEAGPAVEPAKPTQYETTLTIPGAQIYIPANAVNPETKTYNVVIHFKSSASHLAKSGLNTIVVTANEAGGKQFTGDFAKSYSKAKRGDFVSKILGTIQSYLAKKIPEAKLGKWGMSAFSGGSGAVNQILKEKNYPVEPSYIGMYDAMHGEKQIQEWAQENNIAGDPAKKLVVVHSAIDPVKYQSTTEAANKLAENLGVESTQVSWQPGSETQPVSQKSRGGINIYQMYDQGNVPLKQLKEQHNSIMRGIGDVMRLNLSDW